MIGEPRMGARSGDMDPKYQSHDEHRDREKITVKRRKRKKGKQRKE